MMSPTDGLIPKLGDKSKVCWEDLPALIAHRRQAIACRPIQPTKERFFLPLLDEFMRAMPNHLASSNLFSPIARGRKEIVKDEVLITTSNVRMTYSGEHLDESQGDVWMQLMFEAMRKPLGDAVLINRSAFLRAVGRSNGSSQYAWLHRAMKALMLGMLILEVRRKDGAPGMAIGNVRALHMLDNFELDERLNAYTFQIDPRWRQAYGNKEYSLIDWKKRMLLGSGQDMAKAMQRLICTSADVTQRRNLEWLKMKFRYRSPMRKFKLALKSAMDELERADIADGFRFERSTRGQEQAVWRRIVDPYRHSFPRPSA